MSVLAQILARVLQVVLALLVGTPQPIGTAEASAPVQVLRQEHFLIELVEPGDDDPLLAPRLDRGAGRPVGFALLRRREQAGRRQLELELTFPDEDGADRATRLLHVEKLGPGGPSLVWREWRPREGRTLLAECGSADRFHRSELCASLFLVERGRREAHREELAVPEGGRLGLELLESLRAARPPVGALAVFDPLARRFEPLTLDCTPGPEATRRTYELRRRDGSIAGRYLFEGEHLLAFQWQEGDLRARRVEAPVWEEARRRATASSGSGM